MEIGERILGKDISRPNMNFGNIDEKKVFESLLPRITKPDENPFLIVDANETRNYPERVDNHELVYKSLKDDTSAACYIRRPGEHHLHRYDSRLNQVRKVFSVINDDVSKTLVLLVYFCASILGGAQSRPQKVNDAANKSKS